MALFKIKKSASVMVLRTGGTNCDRETAFAFKQCGAEPDIVHINEILGKRKALASHHILVIPGGFSYGDDVSAGRILANEIRFLLADAFNRFAKQGKLILGVCNGFQTLAKTGLLPGLDGDGAPKVTKQSVTLFDNDSARFECRWVRLAVSGASKCVFTEGLPDFVEMPVAHAEGKVMAESDALLDRLEAEGCIPLRYAGPSGEAVPGYPHNPNGSVRSIAGLCDPTGRVFGLMPHPERCIAKWQRPDWTRGGRGAQGDGLAIFRNAVRFAEKNL